MKDLKDMTDRELDAVVATRIMERGVVWTGGDPGEREAFIGPWRYEVEPSGVRRRVADLCPFYSTDIADAWEVVEKMRVNGWHFVIEANTVPEVVVKVYRAGEEAHYSPTRIVSAPRAICLAALSAVRAKRKEPKTLPEITRK